MQKQPPVYGQILSGWFASEWLVADVQVRDADVTLTELLDFLRQHQGARPAPARTPAPGN